MSSYGPVSPSRQERYQQILSQAFSLADGRYEGDRVGEEWPPTLFDPRGLVADDDLVSVCKRYLLDARFYGEYVTIGGIGAVATPPEHRRRGHVRALLRNVVDEYHEDGVRLAVLWPYSTPFYRGLGWAVANKYTQYELPPAQLRFGSEPAGSCLWLEPADCARLRPVEVDASSGTNLALRRSEEWWHERTFAAWSRETPPYAYGYERDGRLQGYVLYTVRSEAAGRQLRVVDLVARDDDAYRGLLWFLANHDSQVETVLLRRATETALLDRVADPDRVDCTVETGPMARLTGVADPLEAYPWPEDVEAEFGLRVEDPLLDRVDGLFEVTLGDGGADVTRADGDAAAAVTTDIQTLTQLYVGTYSLSDAGQYGTLSVADDALRDPLSTAFDGATVCLREFF